jgi:hypothetical protein
MREKKMEKLYHTIIYSHGQNWTDRELITFICSSFSFIDVNGLPTHSDWGCDTKHANFEHEIRTGFVELSQEACAGWNRALAALGC